MINNGLKSLFNYILKNQFLKAFSYNSITILGKLMTSFIVSKVSAIYLGPAGFAIVGNFKNLLQGVLGITASGFESGVIRYIAEHKKEKKQFKLIISSVFVLSIVLSIIIGVLLFLFANQLALYILKDNSQAFIFRYLSVLLPVISLNFLIIYIVNGLQKFKLYTVLVSIVNVLNALSTFLGVYFYDLEGALLASVIAPTLSFISSFCFKDVRAFFSKSIENFKNISASFLKSISVYILMATYSTVLISLSYLFIRSGIVENIDIVTAGLWEAMNKISVFYMMFFSSLMTLYLLPKLAGNKTVSGYYKIMSEYFKYLIPFMIVLFIGILFFRITVIKIFLTKEFEPVEKFFCLQLIGDFVKVLAFSFAYQFHAKKMILSYFVSDAILYISFYLLSMYLIKYFNITGVFYAYIISTLMYFISVFLFVFLNRTKYLDSNV
jgi:PST family polysaccharide transporter